MILCKDLINYNRCLGENMNIRNITIKIKITTLALLGIGLSLALSLGSIYALTQIGHKLKQIAHEDIPLTNIVSTITMHQLEQAILLERSIRYIELIKNGQPKLQDNYTQLKKDFFKLSKKVDKEITEGEEIAEHLLEIEIPGTDAYKEFEHVLYMLKKIEKEHKQFEEHARQAYALNENNRMYEAEKLIHKIEEEEDVLTHELEGLTAELNKFTLDASIKAEKIEKDMLKSIVIATGF